MTSQQIVLACVLIWISVPRPIECGDHRDWQADPLIRDPELHLIALISKTMPVVPKHVDFLLCTRLASGTGRRYRSPI